MLALKYLKPRWSFQPECSIAPWGSMVWNLPPTNGASHILSWTEHQPFRRSTKQFISLV